jgi:hypothetical protein
MLIVEQSNNDQNDNSDRRAGEGAVHKLQIINFELERKSLERSASEERSSRGSLQHQSHLPWRLPEDRLEFVITMALFSALLFGLYIAILAL